MDDTLKMKDSAGKDWSIVDLPAGLMDQFSQAAADMYPGETNPWMHFILDTIASVCEMDKAVFQMTDIPSVAMEGFEAVAQECRYTRFSLFSVLLQAAAKHNLVLGRLHTEESGPGDSVSIIITGIPVTTWDALERTSQTIDKRLYGGQQQSAMGTLMLMFEMAKNDGFKIQGSYDSAEPKTADAKPKAKTRKRTVTFGSD